MADGAAARKKRSRARSDVCGTPWWSKLPDDELLDVRLRDLGLHIEGTWLDGMVAKLYDEMERRGIRFRPHCWLSSEWFSPDGVPGIAIPFYLARIRAIANTHIRSRLTLRSTKMSQDARSASSTPNQYQSAQKS